MDSLLVDLVARLQRCSSDQKTLHFMDSLSDEQILKLSCDDVMVTNDQYHSRASPELLIKQSVAQISHQALNFVFHQRIK